MKKLFRISCALAVLFVLGGCNLPDEPQPSGDDALYENGVYVLCEGGYMMGNASLWFYDSGTKTLSQDVFSATNDALLGDTGQSIISLGDRMFVVVNGSKVVYMVDKHTCEYIAHIENLTSPRYIVFSEDGTKGYISQMYTNRLLVFDTATLTATGEVTLDGVADVEQMVVVGDRLFAAAWNNGHKITVVDTKSDKQIKTFEVGVQPYSIALDRNDTLWVVCDGGNEWSSLPEGVGMEEPSLWKINTTTYEAEKFHTFASGSYFGSHLSLNGEGDRLYFVNSGAVWAVDVEATEFPSQSLMSVAGAYGLGVEPSTGDIYIADARDYQSNGAVYRYSSEGEKIDEFEVGLVPSKFLFVGEK